MIYAFWLGFKDGLENPYDLTSGITWDNSRWISEAYDRGVNLGQWVAKRRK